MFKTKFPEDVMWFTKLKLQLYDVVESFEKEVGRPPYHSEAAMRYMKTKSSFSTQWNDGTYIFKGVEGMKMLFLLVLIDMFRQDILYTCKFDEQVSTKKWDDHFELMSVKLKTWPQF